MTSTPMPPIHRRPMTPLPWAGNPLLRPLRRWLGKAPAQPWRETRRDDRRPLMFRRVLLLALVLVGAWLGTDSMVDILPDHGGTVLEQVILVLFGGLFAWISAGFWTGLMGAWVLMGGDRQSLLNAPAYAASLRKPIDAAARTAIIMPICNEHVATVFAGLRATYESLRETGEGHNFDFFLLSDTNQPDLRASEQAAWTRLQATLAADEPASQDDANKCRVFYRWRTLRTKRKTGNVSDFCRRWGADYRYMVVLDADSVMTGECLTTLVRLMEAHGDTGIIQTAPRACGHDTMHARAQQFGSRVYGPLFTAGLRFWQLGESHYWGHNAILRIAPFMEHCALAKIRGRSSLAGDIMSHDFVEAALMRRAGWKVWIAHDLEGSFEQFPPNLVSEVQRDRRWCHGNLQNARLMFEPGLHPVHRSVFLTGVLAYLSAPLWLAFLLLSTLLFIAHTSDVPRYFLEPYQLFPIWPTANLRLMLTLFGLTALMLMAPKVLSVGVILLKGRALGYGGSLRLIVGSMLEFLHSMLLAPVRMLFHSEFVLAAVTGWKMDWKSPPREGDATPWSLAVRRHGFQTLFAIGWIAAIRIWGSTFPWWLTPILAGLLLSIPISVWTSQRKPGRWLRQRGLFLIPEELRLPPVLAAARQYAVDAPGDVSFEAVVADAALQRDVVAALPSRLALGGAKEVARRALVARAVDLGPAALRNGDKLRLLGAGDALAALHDAGVVGAPAPVHRRPTGDGATAASGPGRVRFGAQPRPRGAQRRALVATP